MNALAPEHVPPLLPARLAARRAHLVAELRAHSPQAPHRRSRLMLAVVTAVAACVTIAVVAIPTGSSTAFAGWDPVPMAVPMADRSSLASHCLTSGGRAPSIPLPTDPHVLAERRGQATLVLLLGRNNTLLFCLDVAHKGGGGIANRYPPSPVAGPAHAWSNGYMQNFLDAYHQSYTAIYGKVSNDVTTLVVHRQEGAPVRATVEDGWFIAWWPGSSKPTQLQLTTAAGTIRLPVPDSSR